MLFLIKMCFFSLCLFKTRFFLKKKKKVLLCNNAKTSKNLVHLSQFEMPPKKKPTAKSLMNRVTNESMSSKKSGDLLQQAKEAAEAEWATAKAKTAAATLPARISEGKSKKQASGLDQDAPESSESNPRDAFSQSDKDLIGQSRYYCKILISCNNNSLDGRNCSPVNQMMRTYSS